MSSGSAEAPNESTQSWIDERPLRLTGPTQMTVIPGAATPLHAARAAGNANQDDTTSQLDMKRVISPVVLRTQPYGAAHFMALQRWEGVVLAVTEEAFTARLFDKTNESPDEEAEIPLDEVSRPDLDLISPGAIFYWGVGYLDRASGQRTRESMIRFRRLPAWSAQELKDAGHRAERLRDRFAD